MRYPMIGYLVGSGYTKIWQTQNSLLQHFIHWEIHILHFQEVETFAVFMSHRRNGDSVAYFDDARLWASKHNVTDC